MENELIIARDDEVAPRPEGPDELLMTLAKKANEAHLRLVMSAKAGMVAAVEAGLALEEAKRVCPLGRWQAWLEENFEGSYRTAHRYVEFAKQFKLANGANVTSVSDLTPQETDAILAKLLAVSRGKKEAKAAARLEHQAASTPTDARPQLSAPQPAVRSSTPQRSTDQSSLSQSPATPSSQSPATPSSQSQATPLSAPQPSATRSPYHPSSAARRLFPLASTDAPPPRYERPATDPLLRAEQLLDESMMTLRRVTDFPDKVDADQKLRELEPIYLNLARQNQQRRRRLWDAGSELH